MGHFAKVNGVDRKIIGGRARVNGIEREIPLGRTRVNGIGYDIPFNRKLGELPVGTSVYTNLDGKLREFIIVQQGLPSSMYSESCNDTWLLMKDVYAAMVWSNIINSLDSTFLPKFDPAIRSKIKQVKIPYYYGINNSVVKFGEDGEPAKIFFLSAKELGFERDWMPDDGTKLSYFDLGDNEAANQKRIAYLNGIPNSWFTRSRYVEPSHSSLTTDVNAHIVYSTGKPGGDHIVTYYKYPDGSYFQSSATSGVRPAFILPSETLVDRKYIIKP